MFWYWFRIILMIISLLIIVFQIKKIIILGEIDSNSAVNFFIAGFFFAIGSIPATNRILTVITTCFAFTIAVAIIVCIRCLIKESENNGYCFMVEKNTKNNNEGGGHDYRGTKKLDSNCEEYNNYKDSL